MFQKTQKSMEKTWEVTVQILKNLFLKKQKHSARFDDRWTWTFASGCHLCEILGSFLSPTSFGPCWAKITCDDDDVELAEGDVICCLAEGNMLRRLDDMIWMIGWICMFFARFSQMHCHWSWRDDSKSIGFSYCQCGYCWCPIRTCNFNFLQLQCIKSPVWWAENLPKSIRKVMGNKRFRSWVERLRQGGGKESPYAQSMPVEVYVKSIYYMSNLCCFTFFKWGKLDKIRI